MIPRMEQNGDTRRARLEARLARMDKNLGPANTVKPMSRTDWARWGLALALSGLYALGAHQVVFLMFVTVAAAASAGLRYWWKRKPQ